MAPEPTHGRQIIPAWHRNLLLTAALLTYLLIILGGVVGWRRSRAVRWVSLPPAVAILFLLAVILFGALAVLRGLPPSLAAFDLGSALVVLALMLTATVVACARQANPALPDRLSYRSLFARLTLWALGAVFITLDSAVLVTGSGSLTRCLGWPLYSQTLFAVDPRSWLQGAHFIVAGAAGILVAAVLVAAWHTPRLTAGVRRAAALVGGYSGSNWWWAGWCC